MTADERIVSLTSETLGSVHGGELSLVGEDSPYFRSIRKTAKKVGISVVDEFRATMPVIVDSNSGKEYMLTEHNDIDHLVTDGLSCVAEATLMLLRTYELTGKHVVIVGRGHAVKGLDKALLANDATITICHSKTRDLLSIIQDADILVLAAPIVEKLYPFHMSLIVDISGAYAKYEKHIQQLCEYTQHIGKLTVAVLLKRVAEYKNKNK